MTRRASIHPSVFVARTATVTGDVTIGRDVGVWYGAVLRGDADRIRVGEETNIQDGALVHGDPGWPAVIGRRVTVGHGAIIHGARVSDEVLIGMGSILLNGVVVSRGSVIGAGTLLTEGTRVPPGSVVYGSPGRVIRPTRAEDRAAIAHGWRVYVARARVAKRRDGSSSGARKTRGGAAR